MPNIKVKYIIDENGDRVAPVTHIDAVRDSNGDGLGTILESKADSTDVSDLQDLIPALASANNQLADKEFVNSSVSTATATYRGCYNLVSDLSLTTQASHGLIETALASAVSDTPDNNDYAFVQIPTDDSTPTEIASVERYKFNGTLWSFEYTLNSSGFTAAQWAALNSNITSGLVSKLNDLSTNTLSTITKLFGMDSLGNFLNITTSDLASVLGAGVSLTAAAGANIGSVGTPSVTASTSGTTTTFTFNYLKGATGPQGPQGPQGATGPLGPQGPAGSFSLPGNLFIGAWQNIDQRGTYVTHEDGSTGAPVNGMVVSLGPGLSNACLQFCAGSIAGNTGLYYRTIGHATGGWTGWVKIG